MEDDNISQKESPDDMDNDEDQNKDGLFGAAHGWGGTQKVLPPLLRNICHTYPTQMKLDTVISYPKKIQKRYESRDNNP